MSKKWTEEENKIFLVNVNKHGRNDWKRLAKLLPDRTIQSLASRLKYILKSEAKAKAKAEAKAKPWNESEDEIICGTISMSPSSIVIRNCLKLLPLRKPDHIISRIKVLIENGNKPIGK
jgi:hypothetical protein